MSIAEKLIKIAQNEPKVYEAGKVSAIQGIEPAVVDGSLFGGKLKVIAENTTKVFEAGRAAANFLKATASGKTVRVDDVADVTHRLGVALSSDTVTDFSGVTVIRHGKNLLSNMSVYPTVEPNNAPIYFKAGQSYWFRMDTTYSKWRLMLYGTKMNGEPFDDVKYKYFTGFYTGLDKQLQVGANIDKSWYRLDCLEDCIITSVVLWNAANETEKTYSNFQIECGIYRTDYEPYIEPQTATAEADGTVKGLTSLSPTMTLLTDNEDVTINLEYYKA